MFGKQKLATLVAEFLGTSVLTLLVLSVQRSTIGVPFFVAAAAGLTLALAIFAFGSSHGYFNPAITVGMWTARKIDSLTAALYVVVQLLGGWAAYGLYTYFVNSSLQEVGGHYSGRILVAEAVGTGIFALGVAAAVAYKGVSRAATAGFAGVALMLGIVAASSASIGVLNPAVALGIRAWDIWGSMGWGTYVLGPVLGAVIGVNLYTLLLADGAGSVSSAAVAAPAAVKKVAAKKPAAKKKPARRKK